MPSASDKVPTQEKEIKLQSGDVTEPFKQVVTLIEHKIRNMEKRKAKLDAYKQEQEQGKDLIADQLAAVAKYGEVMHCLEFARDLSKQITQMQVETSRVVKKQTKREQVERALAEAERSKELMILTNWLQRLTMLPMVREDFVNGRNGALLLTTNQVEALDKLATICLVDFDKNAEGDLGAATEHFSSLVDGKTKTIPNTSTTYSHMKEILISINGCGYMYEPGKCESKADSAETPVSVEPNDVGVTGNENDCAQIPVQYGYVHPHGLIETPDMDPAVVATSTTAPPQLITQQLVTMQQVIPQTSQLGSQPESEHLDNHGHDPNAGRGDYNGSSGNGVENMGQGQMQMPSEGQGGHEGDEINEFHPQHHHQQHQQQNWNGKNTKSGGGYGANPIEIMEGNDFLENNFTNWEGTQGVDMGGNNRGGPNFRRGGHRGRFQNSNGFQGRGGGRGGYGIQGGGQGHIRRWGPQGDRGVGYDDYRGVNVGEYKPRGGGGGMDRGGYYYNSGPRNGAPRGSTGGRRPYRGGGGSGFGGEHA